jgi:uncharacterized flavoprotein (TIGR03862 family)
LLDPAFQIRPEPQAPAIFVVAGSARRAGDRDAERTNVTDNRHEGTITIVGGGPAGLMAAETLATSGHRVVVCDRMPSLGRKLLIAGLSGLNLTHAEDAAAFRRRYGTAASRLEAALTAFGPAEVRAWADGLGAETFVGSSGRVFPKVMKASPLLRAWLRRLADLGVRIETRHRWLGFAGDRLRFMTPSGETGWRPAATLLALGGASYPRLGSDASWIGTLTDVGATVRPFRPANSGFDVAWSEVFAARFAGAPVKSVVATSEAGSIPGEFVVTRGGIEGSLVYAHAAALRDRLDARGEAALVLDLAPGRTATRLAADLGRQPAKASFSNRLRKGAGLDGVKAGLVRELASAADRSDPARLAGAIKALPLPVLRTRPIEEAISSAGGVAFDGIDDAWMLKARPGLFLAGEMLDWEAPTGGYLITACLATGRAAALGLAAWLDRQA